MSSWSDRGLIVAFHYSILRRFEYAFRKNALNHLNQVLSVLYKTETSVYSILNGKGLNDIRWFAHIMYNFHHVKIGDPWIWTSQIQMTLSGQRTEILGSQNEKKDRLTILQRRSTRKPKDGDCGWAWCVHRTWRVRRNWKHCQRSGNTLWRERRRETYRFNAWNPNYKPCECTGSCIRPENDGLKPSDSHLKLTLG